MIAIRPYRVRRESQVRVVQALTRRDLELQRVPWTSDDLPVVRPHWHPLALFVGHESARHRPAAERAVLMRARVRQRVVFAPNVEQPDLSSSDRDDAMRSFRQILDSCRNVLCAHGYAPDASFKTLAAFAPMIFVLTSSSSGICKTFAG